MDRKTQKPFYTTILTWTGILLIGLLGIILLGGDKITSGTMLILTAIIMTLPIRHRRALYRARIVFLCVVFGFVIWNISTTDLPGDGMLSVSPRFESEHRITASTGIRFLDQLIHIFNGFLEGRVFVNEFQSDLAP